MWGYHLLNTLLDSCTLHEDGHWGRFGRYYLKSQLVHPAQNPILFQFVCLHVCFLSIALSLSNPVLLNQGPFSLTPTSRTFRSIWKHLWMSWLLGQGSWHLVCRGASEQHTINKTTPHRKNKTLLGLICQLFQGW